MVSEEDKPLQELYLSTDEFQYLFGTTLEVLAKPDIPQQNRDKIKDLATAVRLGQDMLGVAPSKAVIDAMDRGDLPPWFQSHNNRFNPSACTDPEDPERDGRGRTPLLALPVVGQVTVNRNFVAERKFDPGTWMKHLARMRVSLTPLNQTRFSYKYRDTTCSATFKKFLKLASRTEVRKVRREIELSFGKAQSRRIEYALTRASRTRPEQLITGVQDALVIATRAECLDDIDRWQKMRNWLALRAFQDTSVSGFAKLFKKFVGGVEDSVVDNLLKEDPHQMLREFMVTNPEFKEYIYPLVSKFVPMDPVTWIPKEPVAGEAYFLSHFTQTRYLPCSNATEAKKSMLDAQIRLLTPASSVEPGTYNVNRCFLSHKCDEQLRNAGYGEDRFMTELQIRTVHDAAYSTAAIVGKEARHYFNQKQQRLREAPTAGPSESHLSLSGSACLEYARHEGGKWALIWNEFTDFIKTPVRELGLNTELRSDGQMVWCDPLGNPVCSYEKGDHPVWKMAYLTEPLEGSLLEEIPVETPGPGKDLKIPNGVDSRLGQLLFLWVCLEREFWKADGSKPPRIEMVPIMEPGVKSRIATKCQIWVNLYLAPMGHYLRDMLINLPGCRISMKGTDHLWNLESSWGRHCASRSWREQYAQAERIRSQTRHRQAGWCMTSSDLETATDHLDHETSLAMMQGFIEGFGVPDRVQSYLLDALTLHLSPRELTNPFRTDGNRKEKKLWKQWNDTERKLGKFTRKGVLMGEAGAKMVLSVLSLSAERYAACLVVCKMPGGRRAPNNSSKAVWIPGTNKYTYQPAQFKVLGARDLTPKMANQEKHLFACAGDDHTGVGEFAYNRAISFACAFFSAIVSEEKYQISRRYVHYCQDYSQIFLPMNKSYDVRKEGPIFRLDCVMMRLLSDARKTSPQSFEEPDPFPGKIKDLTERLEWIGRSMRDKTELWEESNTLSYRRFSHFDLVILLFSRGLAKWAPPRYFKDPRSFLPQTKGGRGFPYLEGVETILQPWVRWSICDDGYMAQTVLKGTVNRRTRGIVADNTEKALLRAVDLNLPIFTYDEVMDEVCEQGPHGDASRTAVSAHIRQEYVSADWVEALEQKLKTHLQVFRDGEALTLEKNEKKFQTFFARHRSIRTLGQQAFETFRGDAGGDDKTTYSDYEVKLAIGHFAYDDTKFIRRADIENLFPPRILPSLTLSKQFLSGKEGMFEMPPVTEGVWITQPTSGKSVWVPTTDVVKTQRAAVLLIQDRLPEGTEAIMAAISSDPIPPRARDDHCGTELTCSTVRSTSEGASSTASWCDSLTGIASTLSRGFFASSKSFH